MHYVETQVTYEMYGGQSDLSLQSLNISGLFENKQKITV